VGRRSEVADDQWTERDHRRKRKKLRMGESKPDQCTKRGGGLFNVRSDLSRRYQDWGRAKTRPSR